ncbi:putative membrane protein YeiB [Streptosporangium album]|uniref:Putative membrane protein YeiB n=1 Tax=Streptosporangium album TaxID=47479 RepID=A0A7W7RRG1_9ACTN|nr:DUF418 domain-containing protein [Streptosporangium album]MBB4936812.1 putative membrane protein YeiB [Streptosporangium album]
MSPQSPSRERISALDVLRGFALCGILLVNIPEIAGLDIGERGSAAGLDNADAWLQLLVMSRFMPIFALLFGIGFALLVDSAADRAARPRLLLLRRLLVLLAIGLVHLLLLWQGDILSAYAIVGLVVLLPSTWLPRWAVAGLAAVLIVASLISSDGQITLVHRVSEVAGLFLLGSALVRYGVVARLEQSTRVPAMLGLAFAAGAAPGLLLQAASAAGGPNDSDFGFLVVAAGPLLAGAYVCALPVLLRTPLRPALRAVFAPLGRMALTNYLTATILVLALGPVLDGQPHDSAAVFLTAGAVLATQWLCSTLWLRRYRYGPVEWLWRWATWAHRPALRRTSPAALG